MVECMCSHDEGILRGQQMDLGVPNVAERDGSGRRVGASGKIVSQGTSIALLLESVVRDTQALSIVFVKNIYLV